MRLGLSTTQGVLVAALASAAGTSPAQPQQCCAPGVPLSGRQCADGAEIALNCTYRFLLDSEEGDAFVLHGGHLVQENVTYNDPFCLGRMPHEVAVVCQEDQEPDDPRPSWWFGVLRWLSWLSVACMALTLAAHAALPELADLQGRCHMGAVASLGTAMLALSVLQDATFTGAACTAMAFFAYYWWLSAFVWLHITSFNVWRSIVLSHKRFREGALFAWYCAASLGLPLLLLLLLVAAHFLPDSSAPSIVRPHIGKSKCWFHDDQATWAYFYAPSSVLIAPNILYFVWTTARLWRQYSVDTQCRKQLLRRRFNLSLKLFLVMGISWAFEIISSAAPGHVIWYVTDLLNAMQGLVILVVLVLGRRRVWRALYKRRPCGLRPPERWAFPSGAIQDCGDSTDSSSEEECQELKDLSGRGKA